MRVPRLTLFGRSLFLLSAELAVNAICWTVAGILFGRNSDTKSILSLALLAWTLGLRHALDADHISAIDNATRGLIGQGQLPVTCGLFFSLGHSTIVIVVTVAIAISSNVFDRMHRVGDIGGIIGASVSGSFLFIIGVANTVILWRIIARRRREKELNRRREAGEDIPETEYQPRQDRTLMMRILGPVINFVDRPWKMYPVGVLFGLGFDTASSIALLSISALAKTDANGRFITSSHIVILPLLFTAGMTLIDSVDSVLMLYSYSGFPERGWKIFTFQPRQPNAVFPEKPAPNDEKTEVEATEEVNQAAVESNPTEGAEIEVKTRAKANVMSGLSIILTLMSILIAFAISLITIMGLIGENCGPCVAAAEADEGTGGGLAGRWWRAWAAAGEQSEFIGAAIIGVFLGLVLAWYGGWWVRNKLRADRA